MNIKYIVLTCYDYKGGELGTPKSYDDITILISDIDNILDSLMNIDGTGLYDFQDSFPDKESLCKMIYEYINKKIENIYPNEGQPAFQIWKLNCDTNEFTELKTADEIMSKFNVDNFIHIKRVMS